MQVVFTTAKVAGLLGLILLGIWAGSTPEALARKFRRQLLAPCRAGRAAQNSHRRQRSDRAGLHHHRYRRGAGRIAVFRRCLEQRHLHRRRGSQPAAQSAALARRRNRRRHPHLHCGELHLPAGASALGRSLLHDRASGAASSTPRKTAWQRPSCSRSWDRAAPS